MLREITDDNEHYFVDEKWRKQGEYRGWHKNGQLASLRFYVDSKLHGEYKAWHQDGKPYIHCFCVDGAAYSEYKKWRGDGYLEKHCFMVNNKTVNFDEIPYPITDEERMLFILKYDMKLLPVETTC